MVRQEFDVDGYWRVVVYYDVDYHSFDAIYEDLKSAGIHDWKIKEVYHMLFTGKAKAATLSSSSDHISIVLFNKHSSIQDYLNSIVHEAEHIKQAMLKTYRVEDAGEPPAYTIGYLVMRMWGVFKNVLRTYH